MSQNYYDLFTQYSSIYVGLSRQSSSPVGITGVTHVSKSDIVILSKLNLCNLLYQQKKNNTQAINQVQNQHWKGHSGSVSH